MHRGFLLYHKCSRSPDDRWATRKHLGAGGKVIDIDVTKVKRMHFTILLVGKTGTGKTSLLSYLANIVLGHGPQQFTNYHDSGTEAGGWSNHSQTNRANVYEFTSLNGVKLTILDTPGLADTRGFETG